MMLSKDDLLLKRKLHMSECVRHDYSTEPLSSCTGQPDDNHKLYKNLLFSFQIRNRFQAEAIIIKYFSLKKIHCSRS